MNAVPMTQEAVLDAIDSWEVDPTKDTVAEAEQLLAALEVGDPGRCAVLQVMADHRVLRGEFDTALSLLDAAEADPGDDLDVVQAMRVTTLLEAGRGDEAQPLLDTLRRRGTALSFEARMRVADSLEELGRLREAMRWLTIGVRDLDPELDSPDFDEESALISRRRVRHALGLPPDAYDSLAAELLEDRRRFAL